MVSWDIRVPILPQVITFQRVLSLGDPHFGAWLVLHLANLVRLGAYYSWIFEWVSPKKLSPNSPLEEGAMGYLVGSAGGIAVYRITSASGSGSPRPSLPRFLCLALSPAPGCIRFNIVESRFIIYIVSVPGRSGGPDVLSFGIYACKVTVGREGASHRKFLDCGFISILALFRYSLNLQEKWTGS